MLAAKRMLVWIDDEGDHQRWGHNKSLPLKYFDVCAYDQQHTGYMNALLKQQYVGYIVYTLNRPTRLGQLTNITTWEPEPLTYNFTIGANDAP